MHLAGRDLPPERDAACLPRPEGQFGWTAAEKLIAHRNMDVLFAAEPIRAGGQFTPIPRQAELDPRYRYDGAERTLADFFARTNATGLLAIKDGAVVLERYAFGNTEATVWTSRSMAKSVTATMLGVAIGDGLIGSVDDLVTTYVPELTGTLYDGIKLRHLLQMTSGVPYTEDALDPSTDVFALQACMVGGRPGGFLDFLVKLSDRARGGARPPGTHWVYSSADSVLLGIVVERATGESLPNYVSRKLWRPLGMERDGYWNLEAAGGNAFAASGLGACLRDYGRLGQFLLTGGVLPDGTSLLPDGWLDEAIAPSQASIAVGQPYGYQWWRHVVEAATAAPGSMTIDVAMGDPWPRVTPGGGSIFYARGSNGQVLAINPAERLVVVKWAAWDNAPADPNGDTARNEDMVLFAAIAEAAGP